jgi:hypothetical protein
MGNMDNLPQVTATLATQWGCVYLVKDSDSAPDFFFEQRALWPFKDFVDHP